MKHIKLFENFKVNEGYEFPEDVSHFEPMDVIDSGEATAEQEKLAMEFQTKEEELSNMDNLKLVGSKPYNRCLQILKLLGYKDTTKWEERYKSIDRANDL